MSKDSGTQFGDLVTTRLSPSQENARTLWVPLAQELDRAGPDAVNVYLDAVKQKLVEQVKKLLTQVDGRIDG